jgi:hypothetical protein
MSLLSHNKSCCEFIVFVCLVTCYKSVNFRKICRYTYNFGERSGTNIAGQADLTCCIHVWKRLYTNIDSSIGCLLWSEVNFSIVVCTHCSGPAVRLPPAANPVPVPVLALSSLGRRSRIGGASRRTRRPRLPRQEARWHWYCEGLKWSHCSSLSGGSGKHPVRSSVFT